MGDFASSTITDLRQHMMGNNLDGFLNNNGNNAQAQNLGNNRGQRLNMNHTISGGTITRP